MYIVYDIFLGVSRINRVVKGNSLLTQTLVLGRGLGFAMTGAARKARQSLGEEVSAKVVMWASQPTPPRRVP